MLDLFVIYWVAILASVLMASGLAMLGAQLAARDRTMQTMCLSQGAMLGVLLGIGLSQAFAIGKGGSTLLPLIFAGVAAFATFILTELLIHRRSVSSNTQFTAVFALLLSAGYLVSALFPALESHVTQRYFGDLATMGERESWFGVAFGLFLILISVRFLRNITRDSFRAAIMGQGLTTESSIRLFSFLSLFTICFSVQVMGFLFTIGSLFIATAILSSSCKLGLHRHVALVASVNALGASGGFAISLWSSRLPTVPCIILFMGLLAFGYRFLSQRRPFFDWVENKAMAP
jgi:zinc/manganese transport system permease protein